MADSPAFPGLLRFLGLAALPILVPLACALQSNGIGDGSIPSVPDVTTAGPGGAGGMTGSGGGGGTGGVAGSGGAGGGSTHFCGDGQVDLDLGEECDDANTKPGDGCTGCLNCNDTGDLLDPKSWHCYTYVTSSTKTWAEARKDCQARGGDLASISTPAEDDYLNGKTTQEVWIGGNDQATECVFTWPNGEPWYPRWGGGEPNNFNGDEDCVTLRDDGQFNDSNCGTARAYLCERIPQGGCGDAIVQPGEECDDGNDKAGDGCDQCKVECKQGEVKNPLNLHCYRVVTGADKSWDGAKSACSDSGDGSYLAAITTPHEAAFFKDLVKDLKNPLWLGMKLTGSWTWVTNEPNCWALWAPGQPSFTYGEYCVEAAIDARWNNNECDLLRAYVCERSPLGN